MNGEWTYAHALKDMVRVKYTECRVMKTIDNDEDALRIIESVFEAI